MSRPNFVPRSQRDFTSKIREVIAQTSCKRHKVPEGEPCFQLRMDSQEGYYASVCNVRATKIFNGIPTRAPKKERR